MGLTQEYCAFRDRYQGWRQGKADGATGELNTSSLLVNQKGFGFWYPRLHVWRWRRTLSYWISVTFFEGALFFTISSFLGCFPTRLGPYKESLTTMGFVAGKINFIICTYFMCLETINLEVQSDENDEDGASPQDVTLAEKEGFHWWPFHAHVALSKLRRVGAGPWPYFAAVLYFLGCGWFTLGLAVEFAPLPEDFVRSMTSVSFTFGSLGFLMGGLAEMVENGCFTTCKYDAGYWGAILNTLGAIWFLIGALLFFSPGNTFWAYFCFGVGSVIFTLGSSIMIIMWKDEQFGLTFFTALNHLDRSKPSFFPPDASPSSRAPGKFSRRGATFVMLYCLAATTSVYDFLISLADLNEAGDALPMDYVIERSINALLPSIFSHLMIALNSCVLKAPKEAPFRQLYFGCRLLAVLMVANSTANMVMTIQRTADYEYISCKLRG